MSFSKVSFGVYSLQSNFIISCKSTSHTNHHLRGKIVFSIQSRQIKAKKFTKMALNPRFSGEHIVANAKSLTVKPEGIVKLTEAVISVG